MIFLYTDDAEEDPPGTEHVGGYNAFDGVVDGSDDDGSVSYQELKARAKVHIQSLLGATVTRKHKWGEMTWKVVAEVHDEEEILEPSNIGLKGFNFETSKETIFAEIYLYLQSIHYEDELQRANSHVRSDNLVIRRKNQHAPRHQRIRVKKEFSHNEWLTAKALMIGASCFSEKGKFLFLKETMFETIESSAGFTKYMKHYRFNEFRHYYPMVMESEEMRQDGDPWWRYTGYVQKFNESRKEKISSGNWIVIDEMMSAYRPRKTKSSDLPHLSYVQRKPEDLGTELKNAGCCILRTQLGMECMEGMWPMRAKRLTPEMGATAACTVRLLEAVMDDTKRNGGMLGDSWFGSVRAAAECSDRGKRAILCVSLILWNSLCDMFTKFFFFFYLRLKQIMAYSRRHTFKRPSRMHLEVCT